jgi:YVTN family beta-propeller protein
LTGSLRLDAGRVVDEARFPGRQARLVFAYLVLERARPIPRDELAELLWGGTPPPTWEKALIGVVSKLRALLAECGAEEAPTVTSAFGCYQLHLPEGTWVDVEAARSSLAQGDAEHALELSRSPFLPGESGMWVESRRRELDDILVRALDLLADASLATGDATAAVAWAREAVEREPLREAGYQRLMRAHAAANDQAAALLVYDDCRHLLAEQLGAHPSPATQALHRDILRGEGESIPSGDAGPVPVPEPDGPRDPGSNGAEQAAHGRVSRRGRLVAVGAAGLLVAAALAAAVVGLQGNAGVATATANSLAAIDPGTDHVVGDVTVGTRPGALAFGAGSLWVGNRDDETVSRVLPSSLAVSRTIPVGAEPTGLAATARALWVVGADPSAAAVSVRRIDPRFDDTSSPRLLSNVVPGGGGSIAVSGGAVWVAPSSGVLARLDLATGRPLRRVDPSTSPTGIAAGFGALWLPNAEADTVTRIDSGGLRTTITVGRGPSAIAVGDGSVWVVDTLDNMLVRIDPSTNAVVDAIHVGRSPSGVAVAYGSVWVANARDGSVSRVNPTTRGMSTIDVGGSPQAIVAAAGRVWVTVDAAFPQLPPHGGVARIESLADVESIDPALVYDPRAWELLDATCAKLLNYPDKPAPEGSQLEPEVAESLPRVSADARTYAFTIRRGFRFSTREPVTASTFVYSIERALSPRMNGPGRVYFRDVVGARAYMAGRAAHIEGLRARGNVLTIRLVAPAPDLPTRLALPFFCAVPLGTPLDPQGVRMLPSAGPYTVASYTPGQGIVLERNPYYRGNRPHRLRRIIFTPGIAPQQQIRDVASGRADYAMNVPPAFYAAARAGRASAGRLAVNVFPQLDLLQLNTQRPLFADARLRRAVSYAIDRTALTRLGDPFSQIPGQPTDQYLPPNIPGFHDVDIYPFRPDLAKARALAGGRTRSAVLYICDQSPCDRMSQVITTDLAAIGIRVVTRTFGMDELFTRLARKGEPFDIAWEGWVGDYPDPDEWLNVLLGSGSAIPAFDDPVWKRRLDRAAALTGPQRYLTYGRLDAELARDAAPAVAYANRPAVYYLSRRLGCRVYQPVYGIDLAALCVTSRS